MAIPKVTGTWIYVLVLLKKKKKKVVCSPMSITSRTFVYCQVLLSNFRILDYLPDWLVSALTVLPCLFIVLVFSLHLCVDSSRMATKTKSHTQSLISSHTLITPFRFRLAIWTNMDRSFALQTLRQWSSQQNKEVTWFSHATIGHVLWLDFHFCLLYLWLFCDC